MKLKPVLFPKWWWQIVKKVKRSKKTNKQTKQKTKKKQRKNKGKKNRKKKKKIANGKHNFHSNVLVGKSGLPFKMFC